MNLHVGLSIPPDRHNKIWKRKFKNHFVKDSLIKIAQENFYKNSLINKYSWPLNNTQARGTNPWGQKSEYNFTVGTLALWPSISAVPHPRIQPTVDHVL